MYKLVEFLMKHLLFMGSALLAGDCKHSESIEANYFDENGAGQVLSSQILCMDSTRVGIGCDYLIGDKLIVDRQTSTHRYEVFTIKEDSLIYDGHFMNWGRGPDEMSIPKIKYDRQSNRIFLHSQNNLEDKLFIIDLNDFKNIYNPAAEKRGDYLLFIPERK